MHDFFQTFNLALSQFCSPMTCKHADYIFWKSSIRLICTYPIQDHSSTFEVCFLISNYPNFHSKVDLQYLAISKKSTIISILMKLGKN